MVLLVSLYMYNAVFDDTINERILRLKNMFTKLEMLKVYQGMKIQITVKLHMVYDTTDMHHM